MYAKVINIRRKQVKLLYAFLLNKKETNYCFDVQKAIPVCKAYVDCVNTYIQTSFVVHPNEQLESQY